MCLPLAAASIGATVVGGGLQAIGQISAANANSRIANANANTLDIAATDAEQRARADAEILRQQVGQTIGQQRAGLSAANVDISRGSAANLSADTMGAGELELARTLNNAAREAYGLRTQAAMTRYEGSMAKRQGYLGAASTLLTTASSTFGQARALRGGPLSSGQVAGARSGARSLFTMGG